MGFFFCIGVDGRVGGMSLSQMDKGGKGSRKSVGVVFSAREFCAVWSFLVRAVEGSLQFNGCTQWRGDELFLELKCLCRSRVFGTRRKTLMSAVRSAHSYPQILSFSPRPANEERQRNVSFVLHLRTDGENIISVLTFVRYFLYLYSELR